MNIVIFCLTIGIIYGIMCYSYKLWKNADSIEKMNEIKRELERVNQQKLKVNKSFLRDA